MKTYSSVLVVLLTLATACQAHVFNYFTSPAIKTLKEVYTEISHTDDKQYLRDCSLRIRWENKILEAHRYVLDNRCGTRPTSMYDAKGRCTDACWCVAEGFKCLARNIADGYVARQEILYRINYLISMYVALHTKAMDVALWTRDIYEQWS